MDSDGQQQPPQSAYGRGYSGTSSQQQQQQNYPYQQLPYGQPMFEPFAQQPTASQGMGGPGGPGQVPPSGMRRPQQGLKLEVADLRIIKECNKESFYKRCLPMMVGSNLGLYALMQKYPPKNPQRRAAFYIFASCFGWFSGKISYRKTLEDRLIMSGNDTELVRKLRLKRGLVTEPPPDAFSFDSSESLGFGSGDSNLPDFKTESWQYDFTKDPNQDKMDESGNTYSRPIVTYDSLREENRRRAAPPTRLQLNQHPGPY